MRLINTHTGLFEEFLGRNVPKYAILSHTWEDEEVSFKDMENNNAASKKGYQKIKMTCQLARKAGLGYAWVDTCCIDKSSSAELSEAINSMFQWYQRAEICYAYLSDLSTSATIEEALGDCRWFRRSWTLQELIAPAEVIFFDQEWNVRGSKSHLIELLSRITGIGTSILDQPRLIPFVAVAVRMSWAANRDATRVEDIAYSLLGIFDLNMPLLYGEEDKAFQRLQEEIIKSSNDLTIFAWTTPSTSMVEPTPHTRVFCGVLAKSPSAFSGFGRLIKQSEHVRRETSVSNMGIKTKSPVLLETTAEGAQRYILPLGCMIPSHDGLIAIMLRKCGPHQFLREDPSKLVTYKSHNLPTIRVGERYLLTKLPRSISDERALTRDFEIALTRTCGVQIRTSPGIWTWDLWSGGRYDIEDSLLFSNHDWEWDCAVMKVIVAVGHPNHRSGVTTEFACILYVLGWALEGVSEFQCSLVGYEKFRKDIDKLHSDITAFEYNSAELELRLIECAIPKSHRVVFEVPETSLSAVVSFTAAEVTDLAICQNEFWRVTFCCEICRSEDVDQVESQRWNGEKSTFSQQGKKRKLSSTVQSERREVSADCQNMKPKED